MPKPYSGHIYNTCKMMYVQEGLSPEEISQELNGRPSAKTIQKWALAKDEKDGRTWNDLRDERRDFKYEVMSPENLANWIYQKMHELQTLDTDPIKTADALSKYQKFIDKLLDPKMRVNVTFATLKDFVGYLQKYHPDLCKESLFTAIRDYKNARLKQIVG